MNVIKKTLLICLSLISLIGYSQVNNKNKDTFTLSGYINDAGSGESLIGATIYLPEQYKGTTSNLYGFFSITLPKGTYNVRYSYIGYQAKTEAVNLNKNIQINISLQSSIDLQEFEVISSEIDKVYESTEMGTHTIPIQKLDKLPVLLGEKDLIKTLQLLPGVQSGSEGSSGLYVRGGSPDQNLILLDGVPVYNANHLFGFFSVFNTDAINNVKLIKGGFPSRYGGRLSSVLDIRMKEGNMNEFHGAGSVGIISSKLSLEGPIIKDKTSFIVSARRTYIDIVAKPFIAYMNKQEDGNTTGGYYFYDLNFKINHKFNDKSRLYLSTYLGKDRFYAKFQEDYIDEWDGSNDRHESDFDADLQWGNMISVLRWNYQISPKLFSNTTLTYSKYNFGTDQELSEKTTGADGIEEFKFINSFTSGIYDVTAKIDFDYMPDPNHYIRFGAGNIYHTFQPGGFQMKITADEGTFEHNQVTNDLYANEFSAYIEDDFKVGALLKFNAGLHYSGFKYSKKTFMYLQPRFSARLLLSETSSIKASYARMAQYLHLLTNPGIGLPTDLWVPATINAPAEYADQVAIGYSKQLKKGINLNVEAYYKKMHNLIEYKEGSSFWGSSTNWEEKVDIGDGESYGVEVFLEKRTGKTTGWIGYTLSWANRQFDNIDFGNPFPFRYDRRHDISFVLMHQFTKNIDIGVVWVYGTGQAVTLGMEEFNINTSGFGDLANSFNNFYGNTTNFDRRNNYRMPSYHRLDVSINFTKEKKWGKRTWSLGLYNAYSRQNPFFIQLSNKEDGTPYLEQVSLFPIIPSVSYSFKF